MTAKNSQFNHLKSHTQYSICEGALKILDLSEYCKTHKITSVGISDSRNMCGVLEFSEEISKRELNRLLARKLIFLFPTTILKKLEKFLLLQKILLVIKIY